MYTKTAMQKLVIFNKIEELDLWIKKYKTKELDSLIKVWKSKNSLKRVGISREKALENASTSFYKSMECQSHILRTLCPSNDILFKLFYSNALACALLTFEYLSSQELDLSLYYPTKSYINKFAWEKDGLTLYSNEIQKLKSRLNMMLVFSYETILLLQKRLTFFGLFLPDEIGKSNCQISSFLFPIVTDLIFSLATIPEELEDDITPSTIISTNLDYKIHDLLYKTSDYWGCLECEIANEKKKGKNTPPNEKNYLNKKKSRLMIAYDSFFQTVTDSPSWMNAENSFSDSVLLYSAWELMSHRSSIYELEKTLNGFENNLDQKHISLDHLNLELEKFNLISKNPIVFWSDHLRTDKTIELIDFNLYLKYIKTITAACYIIAEKDIVQAKSIICNIINNNKDLFPLNKCENSVASTLTAKVLKNTHERSFWIILKILYVLSAFCEYEYFNKSNDLKLEDNLSYENKQTPFPKNFDSLDNFHNYVYKLVRYL